TDCMFASGCSPPRLTATQLPSATGIGHNPGGGLSPPKSRLLPGALIPDLIRNPASEAGSENHASEGYLLPPTGRTFLIIKV
ncbi:MAG: hypothetical protein Q7J27_02590, partial [Syntrophales bacterium]|nr:hypothetical protein [Syntrophales bacterium]